MQPIRRYAGLLDAAIIFSDILVIPQAMGLEVEILPGKGPHFPDPLNEPADMKRLTQKVDVEKELGYVYEAIRQTRKSLEGQVPLIGFCGAPWTLMAYMIEGGGSRSFEKAKRWLFKHAEQSKELLERIADICIEFLVGQVRAGAQVRRQQHVSAEPPLLTPLFLLPPLPVHAHTNSSCKSLIRGPANSPHTTFEHSRCRFCERLRRVCAMHSLEPRRPVSH